MYQHELDLVFKTIRRLPVSPDYGTLLLRLDGENHAQLRIGHKLIRRDPLLAMNLLRTANLAGLPHDQRCVTVSSAMHYLGSSLALGAVQQVCRSCHNDKLTPDWLEEERRLREHAVCTAIAARVFSRHRMPGIPRELAYTAGLLHDCGKLLVLYNQVRRMPGQPVVLPTLLAHREQEEEACGFDHCMAGAWLCADWALPSMIQQVCLYHHEPHRAATPWQPIVHCVYFANLLAHLCGVSSVQGAAAVSHLNEQERGRLDQLVEEVSTLFAECMGQTEELLEFTPPDADSVPTELAQQDLPCDEGLRDELADDESTDEQAASDSESATEDQASEEESARE